MKKHNIGLKLIENEKDVQTVKDGRDGNVEYPVGTVLNSNCLDGKECGTLPFITNKYETGEQQALAHIAKTFFGYEIEFEDAEDVRPKANKSTGKGKQATRKK